MAGLLGDITDWFTASGDYADPNKIDPRYGVPMSDVRQAGVNTLANVSALLLAAGQGGIDPSQRAQLLSQLGPAMGGMNTDLYNASQRRLMQAQTQEKMREIEDNKQADAIINDPAKLQALGISPQQAQLLGRTGLRQYLINAAKPKDPPNDVREYEYYVRQELAANRTPKSFSEYQVDLKKAGQQVFNFGDTAEKLAVDATMKKVQSDIAAGEAAATRIAQSNTIRALLDEGVITGYGTEGRVALGSAAQALGFNQGDERLANTRALLASLAQRALDAAQAMRGQGGITEGERAILNNAAGASTALGADGIRRVLDIADRVDRAALEAGKRGVGIMKQLPGLANSPLAEAYGIPDPEPYEKTVDLQDIGRVKVRMGVDKSYYYMDQNGQRRKVEIR